MSFIGDAVGQVMQGNILRVQGEHIRNAKNYEAAQLRIQANQEIAVSQRKAENIALQTDMVASRALAVGASGGGGSDPGVVNAIARIHGEGALQKSMALYGGVDQARILENKARANVYEGQHAFDSGVKGQKMLQLKAAGTFIGGATKLAMKAFG
jgi:hypothetical protein